MDQNNQNQQPEQPVQTPAAPEQHDALTSVQQPPDAQPVNLQADQNPQTQTSEIHPEQPAPPIPEASSGSTSVIHEGTSPTPTDIAPHNNNSMKIAGGLIVLMVLVGGAVYAMGLMNKTQRLGMYTEKSLPANTNKQTPTVAPSPLPEEQELNTIDTGDPENDLKSLDTDIDTLQ
jgi:hypothetical protein